MNFNLKGKVALITGAGRGIGKGIARYLALREGCRLAINDLDSDLSQDVAEEIIKEGGEAIACPADVGDRSDVEKMVEKVTRHFGKIDILVNNAGINIVGHIFDVTDKNWDKIMYVNLRGLFLCSQIVAKEMVRRKIKGKIINISSKSGKQGGLWLSPYCTSKFGVIGFTQSLALDLAEYGINVNAVCPGIIFTPLWKEKLDKKFAKKLGIKPEEVHNYYIKKIPLGRAATAEDIARVVAFLSSELSDYMTGQAINVTGGQEMR